jgi:hypothetical protein
LGNHDVQRHRTSKKELDDIRALVVRDVADATVAGLFADRFATGTADPPGIVVPPCNDFLCIFDAVPP